MSVKIIADVWQKSENGGCGEEMIIKHFRVNIKLLPVVLKLKENKIKTIKIID